MSLRLLRGTVLMVAFATAWPATAPRSPPQSTRRKFASLLASLPGF